MCEKNIMVFLPLEIISQLKLRNQQPNLCLLINYEFGLGDTSITFISRKSGFWICKFSGFESPKYLPRKTYALVASNSPWPFLVII